MSRRTAPPFAVALALGLVLLTSGCQQGELREERYDTGQLKARGHVVQRDDGDWIRTGKWVGFWPSGQKAFEGHFKGGERHGEYRLWYENGQLKSKGSYRHNQQHGRFEGWHENGTKAFEGHFEEGQQHGPWTGWDPEGNPRDPRL